LTFLHKDSNSSAIGRSILSEEHKSRDVELLGLDEGVNLGFLQ
jgi:hypothetical protein